MRIYLKDFSLQAYNVDSLFSLDIGSLCVSMHFYKGTKMKESVCAWRAQKPCMYGSCNHGDRGGAKKPLAGT